MAATMDSDGLAPERVDLPRPPALPSDGAGWIHEDEHGWMAQYSPWHGTGVFLTRGDYAVVSVTPEEAGRNTGYGIGIAVRGSYRRRVRGSEQVVDSNTGFLRYDGDEVGVSYPGGVGTMTYLTVDPDTCPGFDTIATAPAFTVTPAMALAHMQLLRAREQQADDTTMEVLSLELLNGAVAQHDERINSYSRRTTADSRRRLVTQACELLHRSEDPPGLVAIARTIGCSPFHLSRIFREITGMTIPQYRKRLRINDALRRMGEGESDLAAIAAAAGFADHSHMTRSMVAQFGTPPSRLRDELQIRLGGSPIPWR